MPMLDDHRSAGAPVVRLARRGRLVRPGRRTWRRRSRRAQVSAVATILGLLLVVTFIANYISTTLPNTMGQNDLQHDVEVENQVAQLSALMQVTAESGAISAQVSQAVTLGSVGAPPFAAADSSTIAPGNQSSGLGVNFTLAGPSSYNPPTGFPASNLANLPAVCSPRPPTTTMTCGTHKGDVYAWNFSAGDGLAYSVTMGTGKNLVELNFATNGSTISVSGLSGMPTYIQILGSNDTLSLSNNGGGNNPISVNITGNYDTIATGSFPGGSSTIIIHVLGDNNIINGDSASSGGGNTFYVSIVGTGNSLLLTPSGGDDYHAYLTGFDVLNPSSPYCPYGALAHTNPITGYTNAIGQSENSYLYETFNNSTAYPGSGTVYPGSQPTHRFSITNGTEAPFACPFFSQFVLPIPAGGAPPSAALVVHLNNVYSTRAEVALDQGAVVYAQPGGLPVFVVPPRISLSNGVLSVFVPRFSGLIGSESGVGTADVSLRLLNTQEIALPSNHFSLLSGTAVTIKVISPYVAAWYAYFHASSSAFAPYVTCTGSNSVCTALYNPGGPLGTVTLSIPTTGLHLNLLLGLFAVTLA